MHVHTHTDSSKEYNQATKTKPDEEEENQFPCRNHVFFWSYYSRTYVSIHHVSSLNLFFLFTPSQKLYDTKTTNTAARA